MKNSISILFFLATSILNCTFGSFSSSLVLSANNRTSLRFHSRNSTAVNADDTRMINLLYGGRNNSLSYNSCDSLMTCKDCTSTYTCHWCDRSESCHVRGSIYGCTWGDECNNNVKPPKKENSTCASKKTCSDCALVSHFCHWCEHDNACHAVGSRYGCAIGVDCYSNDRCRRNEPESFPLPSSPIEAVIAALYRVPATIIIIIAFLGTVSCGCIRCCFYFVSNTDGAHDDLSTSVAPTSEVGDANFTRLGPISDEIVLTEGNEPNDDCDDENNDSGDNADDGGVMPIELQLQAPQQCDELPTTTMELNNRQQQHPSEERDNPDVSMDDTRQNNFNQYQIRDVEYEIESRHTNRSYRFCDTLYILSVFIVGFAVGTTIFFYPQVPVYNVCNDEVAWAGIMKNIITFKFEASFEVLASLSNPNRASAALDRGNGSFSFDGKEFGTFEIPPLMIDPMTITDFMIIVTISPADKRWAIQLAEAYYKGNLILDADFEGVIRVPALFGYSREINVNNIVVDINAESDRNLCKCSTWEDDKNHSIASLLQLMESQSSFL